MFRASARTMVLGAVGLLAAGTAAPAAAADPAHANAPVRTAVAPARDGVKPRSCHQPACRDVRAEGARKADDPTFKPFDPHIHLGRIAVASMEGVWLCRGPKVHHEPIMVSPIVVGDAITLALGGRF
jgi:hypothetical protein